MRQATLCLLILTCAAVICGLGGVAHAEGSHLLPTRHADKPWAVDLEVGGPVLPNGALGLSVTRLFGEHFGLSGGVGFKGVSLMPKLQLVDRNVAFALRVGPSISAGFSDQEFLCGSIDDEAECITEEVVGPVVWGHADGSIVYQTDSGVRFGLLVGFSRIFHAEDVKITSSQAGALPDQSLDRISLNNQPYAGLILGGLF